MPASAGRLGEGAGLDTREVAVDKCETLVWEINEHIQHSIRSNKALPKEYEQALVRSKAKGV